MPTYAKHIMRASLALLICLTTIALPVMLAAAFAEGSLAAGSEALLQLSSVTVMFVVGAGYIALRTAWRKTGGAQSDTVEPTTGDVAKASTDGAEAYSFLDRAFHRVVLSSATLGEVLADLDASITGKVPVPVTRPVFVTGLARAGTTVLMRTLHRSGVFASLTYADMPMVMAPNIWARFARMHGKARVGRERAHGDGVMVDFDAPEALEEVFWRCHHGTDYILNDRLITHAVPPETVEIYRGYQSRVCHRYGRARYLAKNNNLMLRLVPLATALPDATFLVPVRDPVAQAYSLLRQHTRFAGAGAFTEAYMRWLVHHEFGPDHRPFALPGQSLPSGDTSRLAYWVEVWIAAYAYLETVMKAVPNQVHPVIYEKLGGNNFAAWQRVAALAQIEVTFTHSDFVPVEPPGEDLAIEAGVDRDRIAVAKKLYTRLTERTLFNDKAGADST